MGERYFPPNLALICLTVSEKTVLRTDDGRPRDDVALLCQKLKKKKKKMKQTKKCLEILWTGWGIFDVIMFKVILGPFGALVSKSPVSRKCLAVE